MHFYDLYQVHSKEELYEQLTNKCMMIKKENKEFKKSKTSMEMTIERQKTMLAQNEQEIMEKDKKIGLLKDNQRNISDKMRKMERDMNVRFDEYDNKLKIFTEEKMRLISKLNEAKKDKKHNKHEYDDIVKRCGVLQEENDKLLNDIEKLKYFISDTNRRSMELVNNLEYNLAASNGSGNDQSNLSSDISLTMTYSKGRFPAGDTSQNFV